MLMFFVVKIINRKVIMYRNRDIPCSSPHKMAVTSLIWSYWIKLQIFLRMGIAEIQRQNGHASKCILHEINIAIVL